MTKELDWITDARLTELCERMMNLSERLEQEWLEGHMGNIKPLERKLRKAEAEHRKIVTKLGNDY